MPGPGQGKQAHKKKWHKSASTNVNANIAAINTITTASSTMALSATMAPSTTLLPSNTTATSISTPDTSSFTYSHKEVQQLLEDARLDGYQEGKEEGHSSGHTEGYEYGYDACRWISEQRQEEAQKKSRLEGYGIGLREGYDVGLKRGEENRQAKEKDEVAKAIASKEAETTARNNSSTQTDNFTTTVDVDTQTTPFDETPPSPSPSTSPSPSPSQLSTSLTATTMTTSRLVPQHEFLLPAARKRRHSLPDPCTVLHLAPQPLVSHPEPVCSAATSQTKTTTNWAATTSKTTTRATCSSQTSSRASENVTRALNEIRRRSTAQEIDSRDDEQLCSPNRIVYLPNETCQLQRLQRRPVQPLVPPTPPQPVPLPPVVPPEPTTTPHAPTRTATSSTTRMSTTACSLALPHSGPLPGALKRRRTLPEPTVGPQLASQSPVEHETCRVRAVSSPPASNTPAASLMVPSTTVDTPCSLSVTPSLPVHPSSPQLGPKPAVSPPPARFDWAEDSESLPIPLHAAPTSPRDLSGLCSNPSGPFRSLRRRARRYDTVRRRTPPNFFSAPRVPFPLSPPSFAQPQPFISRRHPSGIGPGRPVVIVPFGVAHAPLAPLAPAPAPTVLKLDWDSDPRLINLSQALRALGWTPPC